MSITNLFRIFHGRVNTSRGRLVALGLSAAVGAGILAGVVQSAVGSLVGLVTAIAILWLTPELFRPSGDRPSSEGRRR